MRRIDSSVRLWRLLPIVAVVWLTACVNLQTSSAPVAAKSNAASAPKQAATAPVRQEPEMNPQSRQAYEQALTMLKAGRYADAERELIVLTVKEPTFAGPHANLGILYRRTGKTAEAIRALERAIDLNARASYYNELGMVQRAEGRFDHAKRSYEKAIGLDPDYAYAHLNLGILYDLYLQEPDKALAHYERYQALVPNEATTIGKWIADLKRRSNRTAEQNKGGKSG